MSLSTDNIIDPLAVLHEGRELLIPPIHFVRVSCRKSIDAHYWIWNNLVGRFSVQSSYAGFEDPAEASMFALVCDQFQKTPL